MICMGIDPGKHVGWCVVDVTETSARWVEGGVIELSDGGERDLADALSSLMVSHHVERVAIEDYARRFVSPSAAQQMIQAAQSCGIIRGLLTAWFELRVEVVAYPAHVWRKAIAGNGQAKDAQIKWALEELLGVSLPKRTNAHSRDACGLAIYAGRQT